METKINYAKSRFLFSMAGWALYLSSDLIWTLFTGKEVPVLVDIEPKKSFVLFLIIVILTLIRDKYEKQVLKKNQENNNFLGRAVFGPIVFLCFTVFMMNKLSAFYLFLHLLFLVSFCYFYYEDLKITLGLETLLPVDENGL